MKKYSIIAAIMFATLISVTFASIISYDETGDIIKRNIEQMEQANTAAEMLREENAVIQLEIDALQLKIDKNNEAIESHKENWSELNSEVQLLFIEERI